MTDTPIPVFAVNLAYRTDRRASIEEQFAGRPEFSLTVVPAIEHRNGPYGLWQTFYGIVERQAEKGSPYFVFCEDDHIFTEDYSEAALRHYIAQADSLGADLLSGGMSVVKTPVEAAPGLFWVSWFNGMQFTVIFKRCYDKILAVKTTGGYAVDILLSAIARRKYVISPYLSVQREFGYSDATATNAEDGRVTQFFTRHRALLSKLHQVRAHYSAITPEKVKAIFAASMSGVTIPVHAINMKERTDRLAHIRRQFAGRPEFDLRIVEASRHEIGAVGLWHSICGIISRAREAGEDFVVICEDDHIFTENYSPDHFLHQIMLASAMGAQMLSGGVGDFGNLVPLPGGLCWVDRFWCTQFMVIFRRAYDLILNAGFSLRDVADDKISDLLTAKFLTVPFISEQTDFGYSDITLSNNRDSMILRHFDNARRMLTHYRAALTPPGATHDSPGIRAYLAAPEYPKCLHLGCGDNMLPGWLNTDVAPGYGATFMDVSQPFPMPDAAVDFIFAEHLIDLMDHRQLTRLLSECRRVLKPGGTIRLTFYSSEAIARLYSNVPPCHDYIHEAAKTYLPGYNAADFSNQELRSILITEICKKFHNLYLHDKQAVISLLKRVGFNTATLRPNDFSPNTSLHNVNRHKSYSHPAVYNFEAITIEAY